MCNYSNYYSNYYIHNKTFIPSWCPESVRWLLSVGRKEAAQKLVLRAASANKVSIPDSVMDRIDEEDDETKQAAADPDSSLRTFWKFVTSPWPLTYMMVVSFLM